MELHCVGLPRQIMNKYITKGRKLVSKARFKGEQPDIQNYSGEISLFIRRTEQT
jgi:hypothetical protein